MFGISKYIIAGLILLMGSMVFLGRWYYYDTQETLRLLNENNATLKANQTQLQQAIDFNNATIARQVQDAEQIATANARLRSQLVDAEKYADDLAGKLRRHDLTVLTMQRPGLIERRVNDATKQLFREMEAITGSDPTNQ
jgi:hypothetical protein